MPHDQLRRAKRNTVLENRVLIILSWLNVVQNILLNGLANPIKQLKLLLRTEYDRFVPSKGTVVTGRAKKREEKKGKRTFGNVT